MRNDYTNDVNRIAKGELITYSFVSQIDLPEYVSARAHSSGSVQVSKKYVQGPVSFCLFSSVYEMSGALFNV